MGQACCHKNVVIKNKMNMPARPKSSIANSSLKMTPNRSQTDKISNEINSGKLRNSVDKVSGLSDIIEKSDRDVSIGDEVPVKISKIKSIKEKIHQRKVQPCNEVSIQQFFVIPVFGISAIITRKQF